MIIFKNLFLTFLFVIFSRAKFQIIFECEIEQLNKRERERERERKSWNLLTFCEWGGYNNKKKIRANKTFLENDYWVHSIWQVEVKKKLRERERRGHSRRGKVQSHVLWRMLGSRVKGEKCIERARDWERHCFAHREKSLNRHWLGTTILSSSSSSFPSLIIALRGPPISFHYYSLCAKDSLLISSSDEAARSSLFQEKLFFIFKNLGEKTKIIKLYRENEIDCVQLWRNWLFLL